MPSCLELHDEGRKYKELRFAYVSCFQFCNLFIVLVAQ